MYGIELNCWVCGNDDSPFLEDPLLPISKPSALLSRTFVMKVVSRMKTKTESDPTTFPNL
jgi:hypothetical protein